MRNNNTNLTGFYIGFNLYNKDGGFFFLGGICLECGWWLLVDVCLPFFKVNINKIVM